MSESIKKCLAPSYDEQGRLSFDTILTNQSDTDRAHCFVQPDHVIPVIFVPGIMGSNLRLTGTIPSGWLLRQMAWRPDDGAGSTWAGANSMYNPLASNNFIKEIKNAGPGLRQRLLNPATTEVDDTLSTAACTAVLDKLIESQLKGYKLDDETKTTLKENYRTEYARRGWGSVLLSAYGPVMSDLELKLNRIYVRGAFNAEWSDLLTDQGQKSWGHLSGFEKLTEGEFGHRHGAVPFSSLVSSFGRRRHIGGQPTLMGVGKSGDGDGAFARQGQGVRPRLADRLQREIPGDRRRQALRALGLARGANTRTDRCDGRTHRQQQGRRHGHGGLPEDTIRVKLTGVAGQSFGAWAAHGVTLELTGEANDYVGKGLSGGRIAIYPSKAATKITPHESIIVGNTVLYGAIAGECYFRGVAGERFAVRNSGAIAVVEGTGDHGCEYMTGGVVVVIGNTGRNFAAGMSGGIAYVYNDSGVFERYCNGAMVKLEPVLTEKEQEARIACELWHRGLSDEAQLKQMIDAHARNTGSARAKAILDNWAAERAKFVKVFPHEYRRALGELAASHKKVA